jgi:N-acetylmuramoyl-L-alanine amidase
MNIPSSIQRLKFAGLLFSFLSPIILSPAAYAYHIVLDPGHGGIDTGAVYGPAKESDLVLKVAIKLKNALEKNPNFKVSMTRVQDRPIALPERVALAEKAGADLFVSLHANAALDQRARGVEFFFQNNLPPDEESLFLASQENQAMHATKEDVSSDEPSKKSDVAAIIEDLHRQNRIYSSLKLSQTLARIWEQGTILAPATIKQAPFYVISRTSMPSVLIEIGFLSNPKESKKLLSADYQGKVADKIYDALVSYKEKIDKNGLKTLN